MPVSRTLRPISTMFKGTFTTSTSFRRHIMRLLVDHLSLLIICTGSASYSSRSPSLLNFWRISTPLLPLSLVLHKVRRTWRKSTQKRMWTWTSFSCIESSSPKPGVKKSVFHSDCLSRNMHMAPTSPAIS